MMKTLVSIAKTLLYIVAVPLGGYLGAMVGVRAVVSSMEGPSYSPLLGLLGVLLVAGFKGVLGAVLGAVLAAVLGGVLSAVLGAFAGSRNVEEGGGYETPEEPKETYGTLRRKIPD